MKRVILFFLSFLTCTFSFASIESYIVWVDGEEKSIVTNKKAILYEIPDVEYYEGRAKENPSCRYTYDYSYKRKKQFLKPQTVIVRGFANRHMQFFYDTYVVEYKERLYFLPKDYVSDNSVIDSANNHLNNQYNSMKKRQSDLRTEIDSLRVSYIAFFENKLLHYEQLYDRHPSVIDSVKSVAEAEYYAREQSKLDNWYESLPSSSKIAYSIIDISESTLVLNIDIYDSSQLESYYMHKSSLWGSNYRFEFSNKSNKTIKYLSLNGTFYNAVNDPVMCKVKGVSTYSKKITGPIEPGDDRSYKWENVVFNNDADELKLSNIVIEFMDGTKTTIGAADIERLLSRPSTPSSWFYEEGSLLEALDIAVKPYEELKSKYASVISVLKNILRYLKRGDFESASDTFLDEYRADFDNLSQLYNSMISIESDIILFEENNLIR